MELLKCPWTKGYNHNSIITGSMLINLMSIWRIFPLDLFWFFFSLWLFTNMLSLLWLWFGCNGNICKWILLFNLFFILGYPCLSCFLHNLWFPSRKVYSSLRYIKVSEYTYIYIYLSEKQYICWLTMEIISR